MSEYLSTSKMAECIGYSKDYLLKHRNILFFEGIHYFTKMRRIDWKIVSMRAWVENREISPKAKNILDMVS